MKFTTLFIIITGFLINQASPRLETLSVSTSTSGPTTTPEPVFPTTAKPYIIHLDLNLLQAVPSWTKSAPPLGSWPSGESTRTVEDLPDLKQLSANWASGYWTLLTTGRLSPLDLTFEPEFETLLDANTPLTAKEMEYFALYRRSLLLPNLTSYAPCLQHPSTVSPNDALICKYFHWKQASDCVLDWKELPHCALYNQTDDSPLSSYLNNLYSDITAKWSALIDIVWDCYYHHAKNQAPQCRHISWDRRQPWTRLEAKAVARFDYFEQIQLKRSGTPPTPTSGGDIIFELILPY